MELMLMDRHGRPGGIPGVIIFEGISMTSVASATSHLTAETADIFEPAMRTRESIRHVPEVGEKFNLQFDTDTAGELKATLRLKGTERNLTLYTPGTRAKPGPYRAQVTRVMGCDQFIVKLVG